MDSKYTLLFTGDLVVDGAYTITDGVRALFKNAAMCIVNGEAPIVEKGDASPTNPPLKSGPVLWQKEEELIPLMKELSISYFGGANNHLMDLGREGVISTKNVLTRNHISFAGFGESETEAAQALMIPGTRIALIVACEEEFGITEQERPGCYSLYQDQILEQINRLRNEGYLVIVYAHGGNELVPTPTRYLRDRYRTFVEHGATLVVGHHPHTVQGFEKYKNGTIYYSLGNFIHAKYPTSTGALLKVTVSGTNIVGMELLAVRLHERTVSLVTNKQDFTDYIERSSAALHDDRLFEALLQEHAADAYARYYRNYITGLFIEPISFPVRIYKILKKIFGISDDLRKSKAIRDEFLILHLLRNKSHHESLLRGLKLVTKETEDLRTPASKATYWALMSYINNANK